MCLLLRYKIITAIFEGKFFFVVVFCTFHYKRVSEDVSCQAAAHAAKMDWRVPECLHSEELLEEQSIGRGPVIDVLCVDQATNMVCPALPPPTCKKTPTTFK